MGHHFLIHFRIHAVPLGRNRPIRPHGPVPGGTLRRRAPPCPGPVADHAGSDLYRTNPGSSPHTSATAPTQASPPETSENLVPSRLATAPDLSWPAGGPRP